MSLQRYVERLTALLEQLKKDRIGLTMDVSNIQSSQPQTLRHRPPITSALSHIPHPQVSSHSLQNYPNTSSAQSLDSQYSNTISNASSTADDGLFLLQAHEELMKCEKAQGASHSDGDNNGHFEDSLTEKQIYRWNGKEYTVEGRCTCDFFYNSVNRPLTDAM